MKKNLCAILYNPHVLRLVQLAALAAAGVFIVLGAGRGEPAVVLKKAVNLCFECIGLG